MTVDLHTHGRVREIRLDDPQARNALGVDEARELSEQLETAMADPQVHCVVLSANGSAFCAGGNLRSIVQLARQGREAVRDTVYGTFQNLFRIIETSPLPIIGAVDGPAIGVGADLALSVDLTYIGAQGWLSQGWARLGLIPATGGTEFVRRKAGRGGIWRFLVEDRIEGPAAQEMGLGVSVDNALTAALRAASTLAAHSRAQLIAMRSLSRMTDIDEHWAAALEHQVGFLTGEDFLRRAESILNREK